MIELKKFSDRPKKFKLNLGGSTSKSCSALILSDGIDVLLKWLKEVQNG